MNTFNIKYILRKKISLFYIVSKYVTLRKIGKYYIGICPFHKEKTASFFINADFYKCFGCGYHGDIINFLAKTMNRSTISTIRYLLKKYIPFKKLQYFNMPLHIKQQNRIKYIINIVHQFFQKNLFKYKNICLRYLIKYRNISLISIKKYNIGYGGETYDFFLFLKKNNILLKEACQIGLIGYAKIWRFKFLRRIIFPIKNIKNEVISFVGRTIFIKNHKKKYFNCLNNILCNKNKTFFGLSEAKKLFNKTLKKKLLLWKACWMF